MYRNRLNNFIAIALIVYSFATDADDFRQVDSKTYSSSGASYQEVNGNYYGNDGSRVQQRGGLTVYTPGNRPRFQEGDDDPVPDYGQRVCQTIGQDTFCR